MSEYKHGDWYCKPANRAEAREVIERAVASGADNPRGWRGTDWANQAYGVLHGFVSFDFKFAWVDSTEYTIEQVRELFPLPGEREWGAEGLPLIGQRVEINMGNLSSDRRKDGETGRVLSLSTNSRGSTIAMIEIDGTNGECDAVLVRCLRPFRSERERWVEDVNTGYTSGAIIPSVKGIAGFIFDALKSGELGAPEVE